MFSGYFFRKYNNDKDLAKKKLRDFYQLLILSELYSSKLRMDIILKGISASNLVYGITDGSSILEFITLEQIKPPEFISEIEKITKKYHQISILKELDKRYTYTVELLISDSELEITIPVEFTKIKYAWKRGLNFDVKVLEIPEWTLKVIGQIALLTEIVKDNSQVEEFRKLNLNL